ncbi:hypothetical protein LZ32DRAFT_655628 [Colletotrichum eremochloae]|nr:hypothetical protein LZ32DRAFT_655628 [Colletotrichum eremochloae]
MGDPYLHLMPGEIKQEIANDLTSTSDAIAMSMTNRTMREETSICVFRFIKIVDLLSHTVALKHVECLTIAVFWAYPVHGFEDLSVLPHEEVIDRKEMAHLTMTLLRQTFNLRQLNLDTGNDSELENMLLNFMKFIPTATGSVPAASNFLPNLQKLHLRMSFSSTMTSFLEVMLSHATRLTTLQMFNATSAKDTYDSDDSELVKIATIL